MKVFSILKPALFCSYHPQEDYFVISKKYPIFVVADGVSLNHSEGSGYPKHSGAGEVAKIFCETVISEAEKKYENFKKEDLDKIFERSNKAIQEYNFSCGRTKENINYYDVDLFSIATSFLLIKDGVAYWWSLCDSGVSQLNKFGEEIFISPNGWEYFPKGWVEKKDDREKIIERHRDYRNAIGKSGRRIGYGVANGENSAKFYLNTGALNISSGDLIFVYTDGFENYLKLNEFISLFKAWPKDIEGKLENIISDESKKDQSKYGREKTLIAVEN